MLLSVIIPVYNAADFVQKSYHSIISQSVADFEIIYVDNNSKDASVEEINKIINFDQRVSLYFQQKQGAGPTRNLGIQKAVGDYIYLLDIDDDIYPNALNKMISVLELYPQVDAVFGKMVKSHRDISETKKPDDETFKILLKDKPYWGLKWFSALKLVVGPPAFLYRSSVFKEIGAYNEELRVGQDTAFDIKLGMLRNIAFLDMYVYLYYKHDESTTQIVKKKKPRAFMVWPRLVKEHLLFYLNNDTPMRYQFLMFAQIYQSMGRQIEHTKRYSNRLKLKKQLVKEVETINIPAIIQFYLSILVLLPFSFVRKFYSYYIVRNAIKKYKD